MKFPHGPILSTVLATALTACGNQSSPSSSANTTASAKADSSSGVYINAPIPMDAISTRLELLGQPTYNKDDDSLNLKVRISNQGKADLISAGNAMVRLGAMLVGPNGPDHPPGDRDFERIDLPRIAPNQSSEVTVKLPVQPLIDLPVRFDLVQEGVNWFSIYGQPTLEIGPYRRCDGHKKSLCDVTGKPVAGQ